MANRPISRPFNEFFTYSAVLANSSTASNNLRTTETAIMATMKIPEQKVILCGEYGAGKSSIFRRFTNNTFVTATDRQSTLGLDHFDRVYQVAERDLKVRI